MKTITEVKGRCRIDECGHWIWTGARNGPNSSNIHAPDHTRGGQRNQNGMRAVWHMKTGKPIPPGHRVYSKCNVRMCLNPAHLACGTCAEMGEHWKVAGVHKNNLAHKLANRKISRARSALTPAIVHEILTSSETGLALAARLRISRTLVSKVRTGQALAIHPVGGLFSGLIAANDSTRRAA